MSNPSSRKMRCLIVDDEPYARRKISNLMKGVDDVEVVGECGNGEEAVAAMVRQKPDLVFLDIQMPEMDGFEVLRRVAGQHRSLVIFVTAFDDYALSAFEVHALDYLLKPYDRARFVAALDRAMDEWRRGRHESHYQQILELLKARDARANRPAKTQFRLSIKKGHRISFINPEEVCWIKAAGKQAELHLSDRMQLIGRSLGDLEQQLKHHGFLRIHRSMMINLVKVVEVQTWFWGELMFIMDNGEKLLSGRKYKQKITEVLDA